MGIGQFHPLESVDKDCQIPFLDGARFKACQQRKVTGDHQPLDMMGIGMLAGVADHLGHTVHLRVAGPEEVGQGAMGL